MLSSSKTTYPAIQVGLIGAGCMGKGLFYQLFMTPGIQCAVLVDVNINRAIACAEELSCNYQIVDSLLDLQDALKNKKLAICEEGRLAAICDGLDVIIESSNSVLAAGKICEEALMHGKHVVMMNSEADLIFGPYLLHLSQKNQLTYTSCDGDQHGILARLIDEITLWNFDLVLAGNIKGFLDKTSNPTQIIAEAEKRNLDYKMATAYTDGSKLSIEMALLANAYQLKTEIPGMKGPIAKNIQEALHLFNLDRIWKSGEPVVDYILGAEPGGGVFVIGRTDHPYQQSMMKYYKMGDGPYYLFYRPYHLCHIESMRCVFEAVHEKKSLLNPKYGFVTNVYAYAKRELFQDEFLDGLGGYCCYGMIENEKPQEQNKGLPICLADHLKIKRNIKLGEKIYWNDVVIDSKRYDFCLYPKALDCQSALV